MPAAAKSDSAVISCGPVTINGGTVRAYGYLSVSGGKGVGGWAAGIGCGTGYSQSGGSLTSYTQTGGDVEAYGETAAGIGGGGGGGKSRTCDGGWCGPVKITGGRLVADSLTYDKSSEFCVGAGIGGAGVRYDGTQTPGKAGFLKSYEQTGGDVTVRGQRIGIGGGGSAWYVATSGGYFASNSVVKVTGGTLTVELGQYGVHAIGGMEDAAFANFTQEEPEEIALKSVTITGGSVKLGGDGRGRVRRAHEDEEERPRGTAAGRLLRRHERRRRDNLHLRLRGHRTRERRERLLLAAERPLQDRVHRRRHGRRRLDPLERRLADHPVERL